MKLSIKTKDIEIEYQDDYSKIEKEVKERIEDIIKKVYEYELELESTRTKNKYTKKHMKATLEFSLPEEKHEFELATNAVKWMSFAHEFEQYLRTEWKYNEEKYTEEQYKVLEQVREKFYELLNEQGLSL